MGHWGIDGDSSPGVLCMKLSGSLSTQEMIEFVRAHNLAIDALGEAEYRVFVDLRELLPLSPEAAEIFEEAKSHSAGKLNFRGSAVLVKSSLIAMQHRRTSSSSGVLDTELISDDREACWEHLRTVSRKSSSVR